MIKRPPSCPREGEIEAFDAGWNAQETGIGRGTVEALVPKSGVKWALFGWDVRATLEEEAKDKDDQA